MILLKPEILDDARQEAGPIGPGDGVGVVQIQKLETGGNMSGSLQWEVLAVSYRGRA